MSQPSQGIAFALSAFLGPLGVDKFYVGSISLGVIQLVLTLTIIGMFVSIPWAILSTIVLGIAILTGGVPSLYPNVDWAPLTQTDKNIMYVVVGILLFGFITNRIFKKEKKEDDKKKK